MTEAINAPVRRARREINSADMPIDQMDELSMAYGDGPLDLARELEPVDPEILHERHLEAMAFMEEPIYVLVQPMNTDARNPPIVVDCWVNGKGAEVNVRGLWHEFMCLPINIPVVTKRKYVEALLSAKTTSVTTPEEKPYADELRQPIIRHTTSRVNVQVLRDRNPKGVEWMRRIMAAQG